MSACVITHDLDAGPTCSAHSSDATRSLDRCDAVLDGLTADDLGLLTIREAAELVGQQVGTIKAWVRRYGLKVHHEGRRVFVSEADVLDCNLAREGHHKHDRRKEEPCRTSDSAPTTSRAG